MRYFILLLALSTVQLAWAQPNTLDPASGSGVTAIQDNDPKAALASIAQLEERKKQAEAIADEALRALVINSYQKAIDAANLTDDLIKEQKKLEQDAAKAESERTRLRGELDLANAAKEDFSLEGGETLTAEEVKSEWDKAKAELDSLRKRAQDLKDKQTNRDQREAKFDQEKDASEAKLKEILDSLAAPDPASEEPQRTEARRESLRQEQAQHARKIELLSAERAAYAPLSENMRIEIDLVSALTARADGRVQALKTRLDTQRKVEAERRASQAAREARLAQAPFISEAEYNQKLADENKSLVVRLTEVSDEGAEIKKLLADIKLDYAEMESKVKRVGLTDGIGLELRDRRVYLAEKRIVPAETRLSRKDIREAQLRLLNLEGERSQLDVASDTARFVEEEFGADVDLDRATFEQTATELYASRRDILDGLIRDQRSYFETLVDLDSDKRGLIKVINHYDQYIDERVLWIRSAEPITSKEGMQELVTNVVPALMWVFDWQNWKSVLSVIVADVRVSLAPYGMFLVIVVPLVAIQQWLRRSIDRWGDQARRGTCSEYRPTLRTLLATLLISAVWPSVMFFLAWRLYRTAEAQSFAAITSHALYCVGEYFVVLEFFRHVFRANGLADAHFNWDGFARRELRLRIRWMMASLPFIFVGYLSHEQMDPLYSASLSRICFICSTLIIGANLCILFFPNGKLFAAIQESSPGAVRPGIKKVMFTLPAAASVFIIGLSLAGFLFTSAHLMSCIITTAWLASFLFVMQAMASRLLVINRRRLALARAQERASQLVAAADDESPLASPSDEVDLNLLNRQSDRLIKVLLVATGIVGVFFIWADVLPALRQFEEIVLWRQTVGDRAIATSLGDVLMGLIAACTTFLAVRNLPGLLELLVLQRLPLDSGTRYAIITICRYAIVFVGIVATCAWLGLRWSQYQWIVAAASVGLGFGLQEIFANFVSGIIVLVERPIRVGDVVTVDGTTGVVSRIRMRATTVTNWDRKELIVPNRDLVTGRVLNWTLTDAINRVVIEVGVEYGSDTTRATELLLEAARSCPNVLSEPAPLATFEGFSDSSLSLVLRAYLPTMDNRLSTINYLYGDIDRRFKEAEIGIAFPHLDLLLRDQAPLPEAVGEKNKSNESGNGSGSLQSPQATE